MFARVSAAGFNLVEVLVAMAVTSVGMLGIAALQVQGLRSNHDSYVRSQAVLVAQDLAERIQANRPGARLGAYAAFDSTALDCRVLPPVACASRGDQPAAACRPEELATHDLHEVVCGSRGDSASAAAGDGVAELLPQGVVRVSCTGVQPAASPPCPPGARHRLEVRWMERVSRVDGAASAPYASVSLEVVQ